MDNIAQSLQDRTRMQPPGLHARLMVHAAGRANDEPFAQMLASQFLGLGTLPDGLGLVAAELDRLLAHHFPQARLPPGLQIAPAPNAARMAECQELLDLLLEHRASSDPSEAWMAQVVATGCLAGDHLWQDLGLWSRQALSRLMHDNFPRLAAKNHKDMKWKKFLYKQLCQREGVHLCRSPSCEQCSDYDVCFGPEE